VSKIKILFFCQLFVLSQSVNGQTEFLSVNSASITKNKRIEFNPTVFYREYYSGHPIALTIQPGDTVKTESIDAGGYNKNGVKVSERGNPLTGPFYIEGAVPGDAVAVTITRLSLNRNYATTL
jgi:amidase